MYKITHNIIHVNKDMYLGPSRETQTHGTHDSKYCIEFPSNDIYKVSYFPRTIREWNSLPTVSDLGYHFWGTFCPSQQFSRGHSRFWRDTLFFACEKIIKNGQVSINELWVVYVSYKDKKINRGKCNFIHKHLVDKIHVVPHSLAVSLVKIISLMIEFNSCIIFLICMISKKSIALLCMDYLVVINHYCN